MDKSKILAKLEELLESKHVVETHGPNSEDGQAWLAEVGAYLHQTDPSLARQFGRLTYYVVMPLSSYTLGPIWTNMQMFIRSAIAKLKTETQQVTTKVYGPGDAYDVYRDLGNIIAAAKNSVFVADSYTNEEVFELYLEKLKPAIHIRLLTGTPSAALKTVAAKFGKRPGVKFEARFTKEIHDRVIFVDGTDC